jgi:hypothetical protein
MTMSFIEEKWKVATKHIYLPEDISKEIKENNITLQSEDILFLSNIAINSINFWQATAAIRLLAIIGEDFGFTEEIREILSVLLNDNRYFIRNSALKAIWQIGNKEDLIILRNRLNIELNNNIRTGLSYVIEILERK